MRSCNPYNILEVESSDSSSSRAHSMVTAFPSLRHVFLDSYADGVFLSGSTW